MSKRKCEVYASLRSMMEGKPPCGKVATHTAQSGKGFKSVALCAVHAEQLASVQKIRRLPARKIKEVTA